MEAFLVDRIVAAAWRLVRAGRIEAGILRWEIYSEMHDNPSRKMHPTFRAADWQSYNSFWKNKLAEQNNIMQKILSLKLTASQTSAVIDMLLARQNYIEALRRAIALPASKAMAVLAAVGVEGSELRDLGSESNQTQEPQVEANLSKPFISAKEGV